MSKINRFPMTGMEIWQNENNGYTVVQVHYHADPKKRDPEWIKPIKQAMPIRKFKQEYELQWDSFEGQPVYPDFDDKIHVLHENREAWIGLPLLIGMDFGLTPAAVICQQQENTFVVLEELVETNMGTERFSDKLISLLGTKYPNHTDLKKNVLMFIDPSGLFRKDTNETTNAQILSGRGFKVFPGPVTWEERKGPVERLLTQRSKDGPAFLINAERCPVLVRGFKGGYRYSDKVLEREPAKIKALKDEHSHPHDALQYVISFIKRKNKRSTVRIPAPAYTWSKGSMNA